MAQKRNKMLNLNNECNVLSNIMNSTKHEEPKHNHYSPIIQVVMNTCRGETNYRNFLILLDSVSS